MFDETKKYKENGHFFFTRKVNLETESIDVPNKPGVYYIIRLAKGKVELVYIGKSGTNPQNSSLRGQLVNGSWNNKPDGIKSQEFFLHKIETEKIDALDIYWFVTMNDKHNDLPGFVEGILMQRFYDVHGRLPLWNRNI